MNSTPGVRLLDVDPDLGMDLQGAALEEARRAIVLPVVELERGAWDADELPDRSYVRGTPFGVLVAEGAVVAHLRVGGRVCSRVFVAGDLVLFGGEAPDRLAVRVSWTVERRSRLLVLDDRMLLAGARWPRVAGRLYRRAGVQARQGFLLQAVAQLPRVEDRLLALFWSVAERDGRVASDGIWLDLALSHEEIGHMVGARRPTVSLALKELAAENLLRRVDGQWLLDPASAQRFEPEDDDDVPRRASPRQPPPSPEGPVARPAVLRGPTRADVLVVSAGEAPAALAAAHRVHVAEDEASALRRLDTLVPDVVLLDATTLSAAAGEEVVARLQTSPALRRARLLLLVPDRGAAALPVRVAAAAHDHLVGSLALDDVVARVDAQLAIAAARRAWLAEGRDDAAGGAAGALGA